MKWKYSFLFPAVIAPIAGALALACNVESNAPPSSGAGDAGAGGACPRGYVVVHSDYASTNLSVIGTDGSVVSRSLLSSGSTAAGLSAPLSGDVGLPVARAVGNEVVAIDRYPGSVLTWIDVETATVRAQLNVGAGFGANPHDVLQLSENKAYVTRYETNANASEGALDRGEDVLVIDPAAPSILSRIALRGRGDAELSPRPDRLLRVGDQVWVSAQRMNSDFTTSGEARIIGIDTQSDAVAWALDIPGVKNCGLMVESPDGQRVAVACSGQYYTGDEQLSTSALVIVDRTIVPPAIVGTHAIAESIGGPIGPSIAYASPTQIVGTVVGDLERSRSDALFVFDTQTSDAHVIARATKPFVFGDIRCAPGCDSHCLVTDAERDGLLRIDTSGGSLGDPVLVSVDDGTPLPPRALGAF